MKKELNPTLDSTSGILTIGAVSRSLNVHSRTLRIYDELGLLVPQRSDGDRRLYSLNDVEKAKFIMFLTRNLAINLAGVKVILAIFNKLSIKPSEYFNFINPIIKHTDIDSKIQNININKAKNKGRKPKNSEL